MNSFSSLHLPTFRSQATTVSEKSTIFTFSNRKAKVHRTSSSGAEEFQMFLPNMGVAVIFVLDLDHLYKLLFPLPKEAPHKVWL